MGQDHLGPKVPARTPGLVLWFGGDREGLGGSVFSFLLLQAVMPVEGAKPSRGKGVGWA